MIPFGGNIDYQEDFSLVSAKIYIISLSILQSGKQALAYNS